MKTTSNTKRTWLVAALALLLGAAGAATLVNAAGGRVPTIADEADSAGVALANPAGALADVAGTDQGTAEMTNASWATVHVGVIDPSTGPPDTAVPDWRTFTE